MYSTLPLLFFFTTDIYKYICVYICTHTHTERYIHTENVSRRIYKKQVSVVASGKKN